MTNHHRHGLEFDAVALVVEVLKGADYRGETAACEMVSFTTTDWESEGCAHPPMAGYPRRRSRAQCSSGASTGSCQFGGSASCQYCPG